MLQVELDHILSPEDATSKIKDIFEDVENNGEVYVVTKDGRPALAIIDIAQLEKTGASVAALDTLPASSADNTPAPNTEPSEDAFHLPDMPAAPTMPEMPAAPELPEVPTNPVPSTPAPTTPAAPTPPAVPTPATPTTPPAPAQTNLPPLNGSLDLPETPQDPSNSSPLA